ncbi:MAG TPA: PaaI family thioesterase [Mycobacteriales bacterium]|jgi:uncharacterized protein (TIGR00369 family)|nr:PaaI family thioesterase [Mycobacteriales bacterium]
MTALSTDPVASAVPTLGVVEPIADRLARLAPTYDGMDFLRAIQNGELPPPPVASLLGFDIVDVSRGEITFAMTPAEKHYNPIGSVHGGVIATLLDTVMGCALHTLLPRGAWYTTLDINVRYHCGITLRTGPVTAVGSVLHCGRRTATAEGKVVEQSTGRLMATSTSTLLVVRQ